MTALESRLVETLTLVHEWSQVDKRYLDPHSDRFDEQLAARYVGLWSKVGEVLEAAKRSGP